MTIRQKNERTLFFSAETGRQTPGGIAATAAWEDRLTAEFVLGVMKCCEVAQLLQIPVISVLGAMAMDCVQSGSWLIACLCPTKVLEAVGRCTCVYFVLSVR